MDILDSFMSQLDTEQCKTTAKSSQLCGIINMHLINCKGGTIECVNTGKQVTVLECDPDQVEDAMAKTVAEMSAANAEVAQYARDRMAAAGLDPSNYTQSIKDYYEFRCGGTQDSSQTALVPSLTLTDCSNVDVSVTNTISQSGLCAAAAIQELTSAPPPKTPLVPAAGPSVVPSTGRHPLTAAEITYIVCGVVLLLAVIAVMAARL
jgi:hypothetical protein